MASAEHDALCMRAAKFIRQQGFVVAFDDRFQASTGNGELPDAIGFRNGASLLIECKVSRSDFIADKRKHFRQDPSAGMGDWRFILCPPNIVTPADLQPGWGLLYAYPKIIKKVIGFPSNSQWQDAKPFQADKQSECDLMYCALRRVQLAGHLDVVYDPLSSRPKPSTLVSDCNDLSS